MNFSKSDRNAILILSALIFLVWISILFVDKTETIGEGTDFSAVKVAIEEWENDRTEIAERRIFFNFNPNTISPELLDSLSIPKFLKENIVKYRNAGGIFKSPADVAKIYGMNDSIFSSIKNYIEIPNKQVTGDKDNLKQKEQTVLSGFFDPNQSGYSKLKEFGFSEFQAKNLVKYRENGGVFCQPSDLIKIYGIDSFFYTRLKDHIRIDKAKVSSTAKSVEPVVRIELNTADSINLVSLSGIGPVFASRIIKYRQLLGGFYSKKQLLEVYNFPVETYNNINEEIYVDTTKVNQIRINFTEIGELMRHPYIKPNIARAIVSYRENNGSFISVQQLSEKGLIDETAFKLLRPYLSCR